MSHDSQVQYNKMDFIHQTILAVLREERELQNRINEQRAQMQTFTEKLTLLLNLWNENKLFMQQEENNTNLLSNTSMVKDTEAENPAKHLHPAFFYTLHELLISYSTPSSTANTNQVEKGEESDEYPPLQERENTNLTNCNEQCDVSVIGELIVQRLTDTNSLPPYHRYLFGSLQPSSFNAFCTFLFAQVAHYSHRLPLLDIKDAKEDQVVDKDKGKETENTEEQLISSRNYNNSNDSEFVMMEVDKTHRLLEFLELTLNTNLTGKVEESKDSNNVILQKAESHNENESMQEEEEYLEDQEENLQLEFVNMLREMKWRQPLRFVCVDLAEIRDVLIEKAEYLQHTDLFTVNHVWLDKLITTAELAHVLLHKLNALFSDL